MPPANALRKLPVRAISSPLIVNPSLPVDPALRPILDDVLHRLKYSALVAAGSDPVDSPGALDTLFQRFVQTRSPRQQAHAAQVARSFVEGSENTRALQVGPYAGVEPKSYRTIGSDKLGAGGVLPRNTEALQKAVERYQIQYLQSLIDNPALIGGIKLKTKGKVDLSGLEELEQKLEDARLGKQFRALRLFVTGVDCIVETDDMSDSDEINMGGTFTDARGKTTLSGEFEISDDFDDDDPPAVFGWTKPFAYYDLAVEPGPFPRVYNAMMFMAEKDSDTFHDFLVMVWNAVKGEVTKALVAAGVGAAGGIAVGAAAGSWGGIIGIVVGVVVGLLIGWLISLFESHDDIVGFANLNLVLATYTKSYYDWAKLTSPQGLTKRLTYKGDGGHYEVDIAWKIYA